MNCETCIEGGNQMDCDNCVDRMIAENVRHARLAFREQARKRTLAIQEARAKAIGLRDVSDETWMRKQTKRHTKEGV